MKVLLLILVIPTLAFSLSFTEMKSSLRDKLEPYLSKSLIVKVFGDKKESAQAPKLKMPVIPKLEKSATDVSIYEEKEIDKKKTQYDKLSDIKKQRYRIAFLKELYRVVSRKKIGQQLLGTYVDRLSQGAQREGIYRSIVSSRDYFELESNPTVASKKLVEFTNNYSAKFLNTKFNESTLLNSNKYLIKRNLTEKALEVAEYLASKPDDLYRWYAIFSSEISKYPIWGNKVRKVNSEKYHYNWAKNTSFDLIKSEIIIKLHILCNLI